MGCEDSLQDVRDVQEAIRDELLKPTIKDWVGPSTRVVVSQLDNTRAWKDHVSGLGVKLEGGLLKDEEGNHFFLSLQRRGLGFHQFVPTQNLRTPNSQLETVSGFETL